MTTTQGKQLKVKRVRVETRDRVEEPVRVEEEKIEKTRIPVGRIIGIGVTIAALAAAVALNQAPSAPPVQAPLPNTAPSQAHLPDTANIPDTMGNPDPRGLGDPLPQQQPPRQPPQQPPRDQGPLRNGDIPSGPNSMVVAILVDVSGSMGGLWQYMEGERGFPGVLNSLSEKTGDNRVAFFAFDTRFYEMTPFTPWGPQAYQEMQTAFQSLTPGGGTALFDALLRTAEITDNYSQSQVGTHIVIMSDFGEGNSRMSSYQLEQEITRINEGRMSSGLSQVHIHGIFYMVSKMENVDWDGYYFNSSPDYAYYLEIARSIVGGFGDGILVGRNEIPDLISVLH